MLFIKDRVCINVLAKDINNAQDIKTAGQGHVLIGILAKDFLNSEAAINYVNNFHQVIGDVASIGLGSGDPTQCYRVVDIAKQVLPRHINQVFPVVGYTRGSVARENTIINCLISPTGKPGYVKISTGPLSSNHEPAIVPVSTAMAMAKEMQASSIKFFPMNGLQHRAEYKIVAEACAQADLWLEPTGGIDFENYQEILQIALDAKVQKIIPHIYSAIIDKTTGLTRPDDVAKIIDITKRILS
ncbi:KDGP aldolase [Spiroplasma sp. DGKH1]|uniref:2-dehydro-3-deoxy-phosphogluconate aldolase n=1 Tax=Spiroplasma sp. DGKH1 TaxID=3050074 RepID=UPI0034C6476B